MIRKLSILCLSILFCASVAWAADSAGNRGDSIIMLGMAPVGIHLATLIAPPVRVAVLLGDLTVGFDSGSASSSQTSGTAKSIATYTNQGLNVRYFFGNSFNASLGYHMRNYSAEATATSSSSTWSSSSGWTYDNSVRNVHLGRQDYSSNVRYWKPLVNGLGTLDWC